ncbi:hypothetical protein LINPERPRIM_LOCUS32000 [Linum perenne]
MEYLTPSYSLHKLITFIIAFAAVQNAVVSDTDDAATRSAICNGVVPKNPKDYHSYVVAVTEGLTTLTAAAPKRMFKASSNDGAVTGVATCYTNDGAKCRACLEEVQAKLGRCRKSTGGAVFGNYCNMAFWKVYRG